MVISGVCIFSALAAPTGQPKCSAAEEADLPFSKMLRTWVKVKCDEFELVSPVAGLSGPCTVLQFSWEILLVELQLLIRPNRRLRGRKVWHPLALIATSATYPASWIFVKYLRYHARMEPRDTLHSIVTFETFTSIVLFTAQSVDNLLSPVDEKCIKLWCLSKWNQHNNDETTSSVISYHCF